MIIARIIFAIFYLGGAATNITFMALNGPEFYYAFADDALLPFYEQVWLSYIVPHMTVFVFILITFELLLGLMFIVSRYILFIALLLGTLFCLSTVPFGLQVLSTNLPLGILQAVLFVIELRNIR